jgi:hypothetical protein
MKTRTQKKPVLGFADQLSEDCSFGSFFHYQMSVFAPQPLVVTRRPMY